MGARYSANKVGTALSTTADSMTITAPATRSLKIWEIRVYGQGTTSAANEILVSRSTGGATPVAITPVPLATLSAAAATTVAGSWTTQPTLGVTIRRVGVNSNGAYAPLVFMPGNEIDVPPSGQVSLRSAVGTGAVTIDVVFEEVG
jgi:hypothetical protein